MLFDLSPQAMDAHRYRTVSLPATRGAPAIYAGVEPDLFDGIVDRFMRQPGAADVCRTPVVAQASTSSRKE